jgi:CelD/BcsL family acetyltransferase involved in cellulose biosynthesis
MADAAAALAPAGPTTVSVECVDDLARLEQHLAEWEQLAAAAAEPNVFYEPWMLLPALRHLHRQWRVRFLLVWGTDVSGKPQLQALFPLMRGRRYRRLPLPVCRLLRYYYSSLSTPLVRREALTESLAALLDWFEAGPQGRGVFELRMMSSDGPVGQTLLRLLDERPQLQVHADRYSRALLRLQGSAERYVNAVIKPSERRKLRRRERRLGEQGRVEYRELTANDAVDPWIDAFLALEANGWKGKRGSAFGMTPDGAEFFRDICRGAFARGRLHMFQLCLDGRPLAQLCRFAAQDGMFAFRTAYDERYAQFSPGVLLALHHSRLVHERGQPSWIDSCAAPDASVPNRLWPARRHLINLRLVRSGSPAAVALRLLRIVDRLHEKGRAKLRKLRAAAQKTSQ